MNGNRRILFNIYISLLVVWSIVPPGSAHALPQLPQQSITSPSQLIDAVNNLRLSNGLPALTAHPILMQSSQSQADYMAATGQITHTRPGGITFTQQLLSLGFPLSGDLSLGGFRAENILNSSSPLVWDGVPPAWQDEQHMNTMLSQNFTHIGAGISQGTNGYYYAIDCAAATGSGQMQNNASSILTSVPGSSEQAGISQYMVPVVMSTARADGDVFHKVQYGQSLWSIAIMYGTTIKNIQALNKLGEDLVVYQGQELLVQKGATQPAAVTPEVTTLAFSLPTSTMTTMPTSMTPSLAFPAQLIATPTTTLKEEEPLTKSPSSGLLVGLLIVAALMGGGVAVWLIRDPN
jgi:LysM repeat protein